MKRLWCWIVGHAWVWIGGDGYHANLLCVKCEQQLVIRSAWGEERHKHYLDHLAEASKRL